MDVMSRRTTSSLNPNAPLFVPWAYRTVEDFSDQWWELVQTSPWFRDYWLQECFQEPSQNGDLDCPHYDGDEPFLPEIDSLFDGYGGQQEDDQEKNYYRDLVSLGALKWRRPRGSSDIPKYSEKAPKIVNVKVNPRPIQQPR